MSFWEWFTALASAASIVSLAVAVSIVHDGRAPRRFVQQLHTEAQQTLARMDARWQEAWESIDQRADERHGEVIQAI